MNWPGDFINKIICGDSLSVMKEMPAESIDMVMTSPPYWGLRDYGFEQIFGGDKDCEHEWGNQISHPKQEKRTIKQLRSSSGLSWNRGENASIFKWQEYSPKNQGNFCLKCQAWKGQLGLEPTPEFYIEHLTEIFNEAKRALKKEGTLWLNISDSYIGQNLGQIKKYKKEDAMWLAAFIDSEGSLQIHKQKRGNNSPAYQPHIAIGMTQREMLDQAYKITNLGCVWKMKGKTKTGKPLYQWSVRGQQGKELIEEIHPHLLLKKKQASLLWLLCKNLKDKKDGKFVKPENLKYREKLWLNVKNLSQKYCADIEIEELNFKAGLQSKCMAFIPERLAWSLIQDGWILRNKNIWYKRNAMPSSVTDRFSNRWEYLFMFSKSTKSVYWTNKKTLKLATKQPAGIQGIEGEDWGWGRCPKCEGCGEIIYKEKPKNCSRCKGLGKIKISFWTGHDYYFDLDAVRQPYTEPLNRWGGEKIDIPKKTKWKSDEEKAKWCMSVREKQSRPYPAGKNPGDVFEINTQSFPEAHFAVFPEKLCLKPIKAGCPEKVCKKCGKARERIVNHESNYIKREQAHAPRSEPSKVDSTGWNPPNIQQGGWTSCKCNAGFEGGIVLDPFAGAGTVGVVAKSMGRRFILIDIKEEYMKMAKRRVAQIGHQKELFE